MSSFQGCKCEAPQFGASDLLITREAPYSAPRAYQARRNQAAPLVLPVVRLECRARATCHLRHAVRSQRVLPRCRTSPGLAHLNPGLSRFDDATRITLPAAWLLANRFLRESECRTREWIPRIATPDGTRGMHATSKLHMIRGHHEAPTDGASTHTPRTVSSYAQTLRHGERRHNSAPPGMRPRGATVRRLCTAFPDGLLLACHHRMVYAVDARMFGGPKLSWGPLASEGDATTKRGARTRDGT